MKPPSWSRVLAIAFCCFSSSSVAFRVSCGEISSRNKMPPNRQRFAQHLRRQEPLLASAGTTYNEQNQPNSAACFFLDIAVQDEHLGRLEFVLPYPKQLFPTLTDNLLQLVSQARRSIDPQCHYVNCEFSYSPQYIQSLPQYRWAHVLPGRGRNAVGRPTEPIPNDTASCQATTHRIYGGLYYGIDYTQLVQETLPNWYPDYDPMVASKTAVLTFPLTGPGRGSTQFSLVRVAESPPAWQERLLLNSAVVGWVTPHTMPVLQAMAQQRQGPPVVTDSGMILRASV